MIPDLDIYRSANVLLEQHGPDAPIHAAMRADELLEAGDLDGCAVFKRVVKATEGASFQRAARRSWAQALRVMSTQRYR